MKEPLALPGLIVFPNCCGPRGPWAVRVCSGDEASLGGWNKGRQRSTNLEKRSWSRLTPLFPEAYRANPQVTLCISWKSCADDVLTTLQKTTKNGQSGYAWIVLSSQNGYPENSTGMFTSSTYQARNVGYSSLAAGSSLCNSHSCNADRATSALRAEVRHLWRISGSEATYGLSRRIAVSRE